MRDYCASSDSFDCEPVTLTSEQRRSYSNAEVIKILFLTADPTNASRLRLSQELRDIKDNIQRSKCRNKFVLSSRESVRAGDLSQSILEAEPNIVHFSGHGTEVGEICLENLEGRMHPVAPHALAALFELLREQVKCVVLNACHSKSQAEAISTHIEFVIGMNDSIGDSAAIAFSNGFYKALGSNNSFHRAYRFGCAEIRLQGISEHLTPIFYGRVDEEVGEAKLKYKLVLNATIDQLDEILLKDILDKLKSISGDPSMSLEAVTKGSVILDLEGSPEGFEILQSLIQSDRMREVFGVSIKEISLSKKEETAGLSIYILTHNEELDIAACITSASALCDDIIVVDSFSSDHTIEIAEGLAQRNPAIRIVQHAFESHGKQRTWMLQTIETKHPWVYILEADERMTPELFSECSTALTSSVHVGYYVAERVIFMDKWIKHSTRYPRYQLRLFDKKHVWFDDYGHTEREVVNGTHGFLKETYPHYTCGKGLSRWLDKHNRYSTDEARETVRHLSEGGLSWKVLIAGKTKVERRRALKDLSLRMPGRPLLRFLYMYVFLGGILDGHAGFTWCVLQSFYEYLILLKVRELSHEMISHSTESELESVYSRLPQKKSEDSSTSEVA